MLYIVCGQVLDDPAAMIVHVASSETTLTFTDSVGVG
jgi:hypothetical protein